MRSRIVPLVPTHVSVLITTSNQAVAPHAFMTPPSGRAHRGTRIDPIIRMYQKGPLPTDNGAELERATERAGARVPPVREASSSPPPSASAAATTITAVLDLRRRARRRASSINACG